jgi:hypothetical protein
MTATVKNIDDILKNLDEISKKSSGKSKSRFVVGDLLKICPIIVTGHELIKEFLTKVLKQKPSDDVEKIIKLLIYLIDFIVLVCSGKFLSKV